MGTTLRYREREEVVGRPLTPSSVTKYVNELYALVFTRCYSFHSIGLRYFNVFGPRQDPDGAQTTLNELYAELHLSLADSTLM